jgi:hypothetical protein
MGDLGFQHGIAAFAVGRATPPGPPDLNRVAEQPGDRPEMGEGAPLLLGEKEVGGAHQRTEDAAAEKGEHGGKRQVGREDVQRRPPVRRPGMTACGRRLPDLPRGELPVVDDRVRHHSHIVTGRVCPPAEVDVVAEQRQQRVEPAQLVPHVPADEHAGRADREHPAVAVVLALVDLARLDAGQPAPGPVHREPGLAQHPPVVEIPELRAEDGDRLAAVGHPEHLLKRVRLRLAVIVQQPDPLEVL